MANTLKRSRSRRRIAALSFLSNITLDGSYRDTKFTILSKNGNISKAPFMCTEHVVPEESDNVDDTNLLDFQVENVKEKLTQTPILEKKTVKKYRPSNSDSDTESITPSKTHVDDYSFKSRINKEKFDGTSEPKINPKLLKKIPHQVSICSEYTENKYNSSSESLGSVTFRNKPVIEEKTHKKISIFKPTKDHKFSGERIVFVTNKHSAFLVCSFIPYKKSFRPVRPDLKREGQRKRTASGNRPISTGDGFDPFDSLGIERAIDGQEYSYGYLLEPSKYHKDVLKRNTIDDPTDSHEPIKKTVRQIVARCASYEPPAQRPLSHLLTPPIQGEIKEETLIKGYAYHPDLLDDPELIVGKHRTVLTFTSYVTSVIDYVKPSDVKREINEKFRDKFPHIDLTLSKLRSLKREMRKIAKQECNIDLCTVAQAYVYFEKLILRGVIHKQNRKLCAGASLILSAKMNDVKGDMLKLLMEKTETTFRLNRKEMVASEFAVLVALEFGLHIPTYEVHPHYQRLLYES